MSLTRLKDYLDAREALAGGQTETAARALERAIRSKPNNPVIRGALAKILDHKTLAGTALLDLLRVEVNRRE